MINYQHINTKKLSNPTIDNLYKDLLKNKYQFLIIECQNKMYCLTKEKSIFEIDNEQTFVELANKDTYYKTSIKNNTHKEDLYDKEDLNLYFKYLEQYKPLMSKNIYGDKYLFGSVAIRTKDNNFITTIRGKENFLEYTIVTDVNHDNHTIEVVDKKATLNAPLLDYLFKNPQVKAIVHINHYYDEKLPNYKYAFPGTTRDSIRANKTSFNIKFHGVIYLYDKDYNLL